MASKICPSCGAKNPSTAYSCSNCAASLIDIPSASFPTSSTPSTSSTWPSTVTSDQSGVSPRTSEEQRVPQTVDTTFPTADQSIVVVRQSPWVGIVNALITSFFFLIFGFGAGVMSAGLLVTISYVGVVVALPVVVGYLLRPKYDFFETYLTREARGGGQQIPYSEIQSVDSKRGQIQINLKRKEDDRFGNRRLVIPGNPKLSTGSDLLTWLKSRITPSTTNDQNKPQEDSNPKAL